MKDFYKINDFKLLKSFSQTDDGRDYIYQDYDENGNELKTIFEKI